VAELEQRSQMGHVGTWTADAEYTEQNVVTHEGSCWLCRVSSTRARPGTSADWQLIVKRSKDSKDAK